MTMQEEEETYKQEKTNDHTKTTTREDKLVCPNRGQDDE